MSDSKEIIVVGGPNGSGKTTLAMQLVAERGYTYLGADEIAARLYPQNPTGHRMEAGRQFVAEFENLLQQTESFIIETTLSGKSLYRRLQFAKSMGFRITIVFTFLDSADLCVERIRERVRKGGHNVPETDIRRRFPRSAENFWHDYRQIADEWLLVYNYESSFLDVAIGRADEQRVLNETRFDMFLGILGDGDGPV